MMADPYLEKCTWLILHADKLNLCQFVLLSVILLACSIMRAQLRMLFHCGSSMWFHSFPTTESICVCVCIVCVCVCVLGGGGGGGGGGGKRESR